MTLAMPHQLVTPITTDNETALGVPRTAWIKMTASREGTLRKISVRRMRTVSSHAGATPLTEP